VSFQKAEAMLNRWIRAFVGLFFNQTPGLPDLELKCEVDVDKVAAELDVEAAATRAGEHDLPPSNAKKPDDTERKIHAYIQKRMSDATSVANEKLTRYNTAISGTNLNSETARVQNIANNTKLRLDGLMSEAKDSLISLKGDRDRYTQHVASFKRENKLEADADYPDSRIFHYSLVAAMLLIESMMNGYFFAKGSELGYLGGISQSIIIAALNILPAFFITGLVLLRYTHHIVSWKRTFAYTGLVIYSSWIFTFNLVVAHYRDLLKTLPEEAISSAFNRFLDAPLQLSDLDSWLLLFVGIFFALIASYDGYKSDDPYPHYGAKQRKLIDIQDTYLEECSRFVRDTANIRAALLEELSDLSTRVKDSYTHLFHLVQLKKALIDKHKNCINDYLSSGHALVQKHRTANLMVRTSKAPAYFNSEWKPNHGYALVGTYDDSEKLKEQKCYCDDFPPFVQRTANDIESLYAKGFEMLHAIDPSIQRSENANGLPKT
jgi:hypothetical protein